MTPAKNPTNFSGGSVKEKIIQLLKSTNRKGITELIDYLDRAKFFEAAGSTKFHCNYKGGLAEHSLNVYRMFHKLCKPFKINVSEESQIISSILHDLCKINQYIPTGTEGVYKWNRNNAKGHATLSIERITKFIKLTDEEDHLIRYHMGVFGSHEWNTEDWQHSEYTLKEGMNAFFYKKDDPSTKYNKQTLLFHMADNMCSSFTEKTYEEREAEKNEFDKS